MIGTLVLFNIGVNVSFTFGCSSFLASFLDVSLDVEVGEEDKEERSVEQGQALRPPNGAGVALGPGQKVSSPYETRWTMTIVPDTSCSEKTSMSRTCRKTSTICPRWPLMKPRALPTSTRIDATIWIEGGQGPCRSLCRIFLSPRWSP